MRKRHDLKDIEKAAIFVDDGIARRKKWNTAFFIKVPNREYILMAKSNEDRNRMLEPLSQAILDLADDEDENGG